MYMQNSIKNGPYWTNILYISLSSAPTIRLHYDYILTPPHIFSIAGLGK